VSIYSGGILRKNVYVSVSCDKDLVLKCDKYLFNQVVMNLLSNAVDAVSSNGRIEIKVSTDENRITILFSDNGHGIKDDCIDKIFKAFYTEKENGTGLGLFSVKRIVESLKGNITVESEAGKGSMFILNLDKNDSIYFKNDLKDGI
jgi:signal transduction histidine kinase